MNTDSSTLSDLQSLLGGSASGSGGTSLIDTDAIIKAMMPITIILTIVSIIISILYIVSIIHRIRVSKATIETRDILREMNERDKARSAPASVLEPVAEVAPAPIANDKV
jgi:preprotein translocase subunit SecG